MGAKLGACHKLIGALTALAFFAGVPCVLGKTEEVPLKALLSLLDVDRPGMEQVRAVASDPAAAARELLAYYRARTGVHTLDGVSQGKQGRGKISSKRSSVVADDALRNVLITCPYYPRHDFGPDIDWLANRAPTGDMEWIWQLNRHSSWGALAASYHATGDEQYAACYVRQLLDWIAKCPPEKDSAAWRTIEAGIRGHSWTGHFLQFLNAPSYTPDVLVRHLTSFHDHALWLTNREFKRGNWGLMEAEGAAFIAMTFPEFRESPAWRKKAFAHLNAMMDVQVRPDGHQYEQCLGYHMGCITWFSRTAELAATNGLAGEFPEAFWKGLERMCEVPMKLGLPDGSNTQFGDDHSQLDWRSSLLKWARFFRRDDLLYVATEGREGKAPEATAFALKESGFYSMRSGWNPSATALVLKCGPDGGFHCQPDNGTFELYAAGRSLMPDSGCYIYNGDREATANRRWFRQTRVHQTLTLDGANAAMLPRLLKWSPGPDLDTLVVENQSYTNLAHRRAVLFAQKQFFLLVDEALGPAAGAVYLHFQFAPGEAVFESDAFLAHTAFTNGPNVLVRGMPQTGMTLEKEDGQISRVYTQKEPRPAFRFTMKKNPDSAGLRFVTLVVPYTGLVVPDARIEIMGDPAVGASRFEAAVTLGEKRWIMGYEL
jgi:heparan-sulfate lyase